MHQDTSSSELRQALAADIPALWRVRYAVRENRLEPGRISDEEVRAAIEDKGRGWLIEDAAGVVQAFAIGDAQAGSVWALFVAPEAQGCGYGTHLHQVTVDWLWAQGQSILWLTTGPGTRAQGFYERRGWRPVGRAENGDLRLELQRPS